MGDVQTYDCDSSSTNRLWVNLSALGDGNVFAILPQIARKMFTENNNNNIRNDTEVFNVIFPSDKQWKEKIYYRLVEQQRKADSEGDVRMLDPYNDYPREPKLHDWNIIPKTERGECDETASNCQIVKREFKQERKAITWTVSDLAKAGFLLYLPPLQTNFEDEQEMRRVYTLIYDVYRYKNVLMQALNDVHFFEIYEQLKNCIPIVWLLFYDLYHRSFKKRETAVKETATKLFQNAKMSLVENALWIHRVKLAAAVARLRIKYSALNLIDLLPSHLRCEKINRESQNIPVTVWINNKKFKNLSDIKKQIEFTMKVKLVDDLKDLGPTNFRWDRHCPLTAAFHYSMRTQLAKSNLVKNHKLILQDKSFCVGPATFWKVVEDLQLSGSVVQTHVNSPRSTAYLANLLAQNEKIKKLMAFSAGQRKNEYEDYLNELGMTNVVIFSDRLVDFGFESPCMEEVVAVYATPPNSYSAVTDPIDLVCSRGGDLSMLEILTESEDTLMGRNRVTKILEEQKRTLQIAMSRPQIQVVLYETHSELDVENSDMVQNTLKEINRLAELHHASLQGLIPTVENPMEINNNKDDLKEEIKKVTTCNFLDPGSNSNYSISTNMSCKRLVVPDTDLFDNPELPCLCPEETNCKMENGCYLALIKRKQVIRMDNKYMIQMAEQKGLFGNSDNDIAKQKNPKQSRKKEQIMMNEVKPKRSRRRLKEKEMNRIAAPTHSFLRHVNTKLSCHECERCKQETDEDEEIQCVCKYNQTETLLDSFEETGTNRRVAGGILGSLNAIQMKTLISPSFEFGTQFSTEISDYIRSRQQKNKSKNMEVKDKDERKKKKPEASKYEIRPDLSFNVKVGPQRSFDGRLRLKLKRRMTLNKIERIAAPTESTKIKTLNESLLPPCRRTFHGTTTRDFFCDICKRKHS